MNRRRTLIGSFVVLIVGIAAWAFGFLSGTDPAVAELQQIGSQMWDQNLPQPQRDQLRSDFRQRMDSLSNAQRRAFFEGNREQWNGRMQARMDEYFQMSQANQQKRLDDILNRIVQGRNSQQQNSSAGSSQNQNARNGDHGGQRRSMTDAQREERSKKRLDRSTPKMRAQVAEFRRQLDQRAQQRGVNMGDQRGWGYPRGFGGSSQGV